MTIGTARFLDGALWVIIGAAFAIIGSRRLRVAHKKEQKDYPAASMRLIGICLAIYGIGYAIAALR
jgi:hypothetical protein